MRDERGFLTLAAEIRQELSSLGQLADEIPATWERRIERSDPERRSFVESTALELHNFYTACERIFEKIAGEVNGGVPQTPDWHLRLLRTMTVDVPEVRPRVLSSELAERLTDYLRFRHLVRNVYGFELREDKMEPLVREIEKVSGDFESQMQRFLDSLEELGRQLPG